MNNIRAIEISQKDLYGITLNDFHNKLLGIGPVQCEDIMRYEKEYRKDSPRYAYGEHYATYELSRSNGFANQNRIQAQHDELFRKHVRSYSSILFVGT